MRSILLATALAFSALVPATLQTADACGGGYGAFQWQPAVFAVSTHPTNDDKGASFILLGKRLRDRDAAKLRFTRLDDTSFDTTAIARGEKLEKPMVFTLVGPAGTKVVKATQLTWVDLAFDQGQPRAGVRVTGDFRIAIDGDYPNATWEELTQINGSTVTVYSGAGRQLMSPHGSGTTSIGTGVLSTTVAGYPVGIVHVSGWTLAVMKSNSERHSLSAVTL